MRCQASRVVQLERATAVIACPSCGYQAADDFAFCPRCATTLVGPRAASEELKVVTTLFCDLVGFTALSEQADPEDVDRLLGEYAARARRVIESHGGVVEKFIGDAVVGVFGVPAVREDDPERAVARRFACIAGLEGMTRPDGSPLQARCGVNTGEALVRLDVDPSSGRGFLTGDAVNTAARLQAAAPPMGVVVGALTQKLTAAAFAYEPLTPLSLKGKSRPVTAWLARETDAASERPGATRATPMVGREAELATCLQAVDRVRAGEGGLLLITGEAGIGKTRLVEELRLRAAERGVRLARGPHAVLRPQHQLLAVPRDRPAGRRHRQRRRRGGALVEARGSPHRPLGGPGPGGTALSGDAAQRAAA